MSDKKLSRMIIDFCRQKLPEALTEHEIELMQRYLAPQSHSGTSRLSRRLGLVPALA